MMSKTKTGIIIANWKMNFTVNEVNAFFSEFTLNAPTHKVMIAPQATLIAQVSSKVASGPITLAAQNCSSESSGAFTGEISAKSLQSLNVAAVILGHSERRQLFAEDEKVLSQKISQVVASTNMQVIYCIGENLQQREAQQLEAVLTRQLTALSAFNQNFQRLILAYEPVWAIGTGKVATPEQVSDTHLLIQKILEKNYPTAKHTPIIYGGSVNAQNAQTLFSLNTVSGFLVGGASLNPKDFAQICSVQ